jgi:hypothetical protein
MIRYRLLPTLTLLSLSTLALGAVGCSNGQSPTEPAAFDTPVASKSLAVSTDKRHGADDPAGDDHGGRNGQPQRPPRPARGVELQGVVASVDTAGGALVLANGKRIAVNGQTQWNARGDLFSLQQVAASVAAGRRTRAEARGTLQTGGVLATTVKAEVDNR